LPRGRGHLLSRQTAIDTLYFVQPDAMYRQTVKDTDLKVLARKV